MQEFVFGPVSSTNNEGDIELDFNVEFDTHLDTNSLVVTNVETPVYVTPQVYIEEGTSKDVPQPLSQFKYKSSHPLELMLSNPDSGIQTRSSINNRFLDRNVFIS